MLPKFSTRKLVQISEEALPPVHSPVLIDNQCFVLTYQDFRKLEEYRLSALHMLMPNGELKPLNSMDIEGLLRYLQQQSLTTCQRNLFDLCEFIKSNLGKPIADIQQVPQPMNISCENIVKASIEQQLQWDKCVNTSAPFPMTYSCGTSTTEINSKKKLEYLEKICKCSQTNEMRNKSTSTQDLVNGCKQSNEPLGAREQLKQKKLNNTLAYINCFKK